MLIFKSVFGGEIAVSPEAIACIVDNRDESDNGEKILEIHITGHKTHLVYYSDFQALVRMVHEKVKGIR